MRIPINRQSKTPLYQQIQNHLRDQILSGQLQPETRLPATRKLAQALGLSRITVQNAYADLESEGLIGSREGSGSYVLKPVRLTVPPEDASPVWPLWQQDLSEIGSQTPSKEALQYSAGTPAKDLISFTGVGDPDQFPVKDFYKALKTIFQRDGVAALEYGDFEAGYLPLRQTITHVLASQGVQARPEPLHILAAGLQRQFGDIHI